MSTAVIEETEPAWVTHNWISGPGFVAWLEEINYLGEDATWSGSFGDTVQRRVNRWRDGDSVKVTVADEMLMLRGLGLWEIPELLWRKTNHPRVGPVPARVKIECVHRVMRGQLPKDVARDADVDTRSVKRWLAAAKKDAGWEEKTLDQWERHVEREQEKEARAMEASGKRKRSKTAQGQVGKTITMRRREARTKYEAGEITLVDLMLDKAFAKMDLRRLVETIVVVPGYTPNELRAHIVKRTGVSASRSLGRFTRGEAASVAVSINELGGREDAPAMDTGTEEACPAEREMVTA